MVGTKRLQGSTYACNRHRDSIAEVRSAREGVVRLKSIIFSKNMRILGMKSDI